VGRGRDIVTARDRFDVTTPAGPLTSDCSARREGRLQAMQAPLPILRWRFARRTASVLRDLARANGIELDGRAPSTLMTGRHPHLARA